MKNHRTISRTAALDVEFEEWWKIYPRHVDKKRARQAYQTARKSASAEELIQGAQRYAAERVGEPEQYTKHASTWLNAEAWKNAPLPRTDLPQTNQRRQQVDIVGEMLSTGYDYEDPQ